LKQALQLAAGAVIGGALALTPLVIPWPALSIGAAGWVVIAAALPAVLLVLVGVHEAGHLLAGAMMRFRPLLFIVGPIKFERRDDGWSVGFNRVFPLAGGMVGATPQGTGGLRRRMLVLVAGGPAASLACGFLGLGALGTFDALGRASLSGTAAIGFVLTLTVGLGSLLLGLLALIPGDKQGYSSDGARILRFLRSGPQVEAEVALLGLAGASMGGQRPRDWPTELVMAAVQLPAETPIGAAARLLAHLHALDRRDLDAARAYLADALAHRAALPAMSRPGLLLQAAYFAAIHEGAPRVARTWLEEAGEGALISAHARSMAEAAIMVAEGDVRAAARLDLAVRQLPMAIDRGSALLAADAIAGMRRVLDERGRTGA
jgi:hypothetical protein